jgi:hypothetical protein
MWKIYLLVNSLRVTSKLKGKAGIVSVELLRHWGGLVLQTGRLLSAPYCLYWIAYYYYGLCMHCKLVKLGFAPGQTLQWQNSASRIAYGVPQIECISRICRGNYEALVQQLDNSWIPRWHLRVLVSLLWRCLNTVVVGSELQHEMEAEFQEYWYIIHYSNRSVTYILRKSMDYTYKTLYDEWVKLFLLLSWKPLRLVSTFGDAVL